MCACVYVCVCVYVWVSVYVCMLGVYLFCLCLLASYADNQDIILIRINVVELNRFQR